MNKLPISAFIIAHNEADRIGATIDSIANLVEEIIVIDSFSHDQTVPVAQSHGARVIQHDWPGYGQQKRFGEEQCKYRWLLNLDADEALTPQLADEIRNLFKKRPQPNPLPQAGEGIGGEADEGEGAFIELQEAGFILRIRDLLPGETKLAPMAHTNYAVRLYNRDKARFKNSAVHDTVQVEQGTTRMLTHPALHRSFRNISHALAKMNSYTSVQAENLQSKGLAFARARLLLEFPAAFFKDYILRGYILRGRRGFTYAVIYAFTRFIRIAKYLELRDKK